MRLKRAYSDEERPKTKSYRPQAARVYTITPEQFAKGEVFKKRDLENQREKLTEYRQELEKRLQEIPARIAAINAQLEQIDKELKPWNPASEKTF